ncbi:MAG TPA: CBS domain-containing protein [Nitrospiraceae bacterium]|nr:CBS domain-containing protein [Nitrospiraceae bacterium]
MATRVVTIEMDDSLEVVRDIFKKVRFHHLLVVDNQKLVGIISDRDMLKAVSTFVGTMSETTRDRATLNKRAHQIMSHHPVTVCSSCSLQEAAQLMLARGVSCLPVTTKNGEVLGIVTWKDVLRAVLDFDGFTDVS